MNTAHGSVKFFYRKVTKQQQPSFYLIEGGSDLEKNNRQLCDNALRHLAEGDTSLLEEVYHRLKRPVYLLAYAILDDPNLAEDVLQDTFCRYRHGTTVIAQAPTDRPGSFPLPGIWLSTGCEPAGKSVWKRFPTNPLRSKILTDGWILFALCLFLPKMNGRWWCCD